MLKTQCREFLFRVFNKNVFNSVYIDYGVPVWNDGDIDIAPEYLYKHGIPAGGAANV